MRLPPDVLREIAARASPRTVAAMSASGREGSAAAADALRRVHAARRAGVSWYLATIHGDRLFREARVVVARAVGIVDASLRGVPPERIAPGTPTSGRVWYAGGVFVVPGMRDYDVRVRVSEDEWSVDLWRRGRLDRYPAASFRVGFDDRHADLEVGVPWDEARAIAAAFMAAFAREGIGSYWLP